MREPISVVILIEGENDLLHRILQPLFWCDEIILVNTGPKALSKEYFQKYPRVRERRAQWEGFTITKEKAFREASFDWILWLDSDEELTPELSQEIQRVLENVDPSICFKFKRQNFYLNQKVSFSKHQNDWVLRLFHRDSVFFDNLLIHEKLQPREGVRIVALRSFCRHWTISSYEQWLHKTLMYSQLTAKRFIQDRPTGLIYWIWWLRFMFEPYLVFLNYYWIHLGVLDGWIGLEIARMASLRKKLKLFEIRRLSEKNIS